MELSIAEYFNYPVDLDSFPTYAMTIDYPIDLNTIKERLENRYYRRINSLQWDVIKIETNAILFNQPKSDIVRKATLLCELLMEFINDQDCFNPIPIYKRLCQNKNLPIGESDYSPNDTNLFNTSVNTRTRTRMVENYDENSDYNEDDDLLDQSAKSSRNQKSKSQLKRNSSGMIETRNQRRKTAADAWQEDCKQLLTDLFAHPDAEPFLVPVDLNEYHDYLQTISRPIDFGTIREKLLNNSYESLNMFDADCRLLFQNSKQYNTNKRSRVYGMTLRINSLYDSRIEVIKSNHDKAVEIEKRLLDKYQKNRKSKHQETQMLRKNSKHTRATNDTDLFTDQYNSPNIYHNGISTRSASNNKKIKNTYAMDASQDSQITTRGGSTALDKSFVDENSQLLAHDLEDTDVFDNAKEELKIEPPDELSKHNEGSKKFKNLQTDSESESNYKSAVSTLPTNSKSATKLEISSAELDHNQNANMGFITSNEESANTSHNSDDTKFTFSQINLRKNGHNESNASAAKSSLTNGASSKQHVSSDYEDTKPETKSTLKKSRSKRKITIADDSKEDDDEEYDDKNDADYMCNSKKNNKTIKRRLKAKKHDEEDDYEDKKEYLEDDDDEELAEDDINEEEEEEEEEEDDDEEDDDYKTYKTSSRSSRRNGRVKASTNQKIAKKTSGRKAKNLDDKENEDDYEKSNHSTNSKNTRKRGREKEKTRKRPMRKGKKFSYKESTSESSLTTSNSSHEEDEDGQVNLRASNRRKGKKKQSHHRKKKVRRSSSPLSSGKSSEESPVNSNHQHDGVTAHNDSNSEFDSYSNENSINSSNRLLNGAVAASAGSSSIKSSRGRLLKPIVPQY